MLRLKEECSTTQLTTLRTHRQFSWLGSLATTWEEKVHTAQWCTFNQTELFSLWTSQVLRLATWIQVRAFNTWTLSTSTTSTWTFKTDWLTTTNSSLLVHKHSTSIETWDNTKQSPTCREISWQLRLQVLVTLTTTLFQSATPARWAKAPGNTLIKTSNTWTLWRGAKRQAR